MVKVRDEAKQSGVEMTAEELSTKVLKQGKSRSYIRGLGVGPTRTSLSFKSHLGSQAHSELLSIRSEMDLLREQQQREREEYQLEREKLLKEREEQQKQHEREREKERVGREAQQKQLDRLESLLPKFMIYHGAPWSYIYNRDGTELHCLNVSI